MNRNIRSHDECHLICLRWGEGLKPGDEGIELWHTGSQRISFLNNAVLHGMAASAPRKPMPLSLSWKTQMTLKRCEVNGLHPFMSIQNPK